MKSFASSVRLIFICLYLFPFQKILVAQFLISGKVIDSSNLSSLAGATVFLSNATKGTSTAVNGTFTISNVRSGQYELVISMIGYEAFTTSLLINSNKQNITIQLVRKAMSLRPVIVLPNNLRQRYFDMFKRIFIGRSKNAGLCRILNPEIIYFDYDKKKNVLTASTDDFLIIENKALGYKIKFLLRKFTYNNSFSGPSLSYYEGQALFEEMDGGKLKRRRWQKKRLDAYAGSSMHFFRAAAANKLPTDGFVMHTLTRMVNKDRPTDDSIRSTLTRLRNSVNSADVKIIDSISLWQRKFDIPKTIQILSKDTLAPQSVIKRTDQPGLSALTFKNLLYLSYTKKKRSVSAIAGSDGVSYSLLALQEENAFFDSNGILLDPQSLIFEGYWAEYGAMADMLPTDYEVK